MNIHHMCELKIITDTFLCGKMSPSLDTEMPVWCCMLAHNRGLPSFSDVRIGNVFYSWPEMAKWFYFYCICHPYLAKSYI